MVDESDGCGRFRGLFIFWCETNGDGGVIKFEIRLVADGRAQIQELDYGQDFALTSTVRLSKPR